MDIFSPKPQGKLPVYPRIQKPAVAPAAPALAPMNIFSPKPQMNAAPKGTLPEFIPPRYGPVAPNIGSYFPAYNRGFPGNGKTLKRRPLPKKMENMGAEPVHPNRALSPPTIRPSISVDRRRRRRGAVTARKARRTRKN